MYFDFCKAMSFSNQADIYLIISQKEQDVYCEIGTDEKVGFFENTNKTKDCFKNMFFLFNGKKVKDLEIIFSSTGKIVPGGEIKFFDKKNKFKQNKTI
ncbi:MAG: hypothetical protein ACD_79C01150G0002 [uncultured bacterium]|nr:MAG: hypothetical protein ACD_79C01150G0002 [uncultured bacterium]